MTKRAVIGMRWYMHWRCEGVKASRRAVGEVVGKDDRILKHDSSSKSHARPTQSTTMTT